GGATHFRDRKAQRMTPGRSRVVRGLLAGGLFLGAVDSRADEDDEYPFLEFAAGTGVSVGKNEYAVVGYPGRPRTEPIAGGAIDTPLTPAYGFKYFSIGAAFDAMFTTSDNCTEVASASGVVMLRHKRPGFLGLLAVGYASGDRFCYRIADDGEDTHVAD